MKNIYEFVSKNIGIINDIQKFIDTVNNLSKNDVVIQTLLPEVSKRISMVKKNSEDAITEYSKITSSSTGKKRFDIMKNDGTIEIGLEAPDENTLKNIFSNTGISIEILREINEDGIIIKENKPSYIKQGKTSDISQMISGKELYKMLHPSHNGESDREEEKSHLKFIGTLNAAIKNNFADETDYPKMPKTDIPVILEDEYNKFIENPGMYKDSTERILDDKQNADEIKNEDIKLDGLLDEWKKTLSSKKKNTKKTIKKTTKKSSKKTKK